MQNFLNKNFFLQSPTAQKLYHEYAAQLPIIDYHNHLPVQQIAHNHQFKDITEIWLKGDHYKWRAMRSNGINENRITGTTTNEEKFNAWAATVPYTMRNPLYLWSHLELQRYFGITDLLSPANAAEVYAHCNNLLQSKEFSAQNLLRKMNVEVLCTTDDPIDDLIYHQQLKQQGFEIKVLPTFRPDAAIAIENTTTWNTWVNKLAQVTQRPTHSFTHFMEALTKRHDFFAEMGCKLSDHGLETMFAHDFDEVEIEFFYDQLRAGEALNALQANQFKSAVLYKLALLDHDKGWAAQWHIGALRNNNSLLLNQLGADAGVDSIGDQSTAKPMAAFFNKLNSTNQLSKTIIYNLNPALNEVFATMIGNFQGNEIAGKMQFGSGWWFLDQKTGIERQIDALSNMGLLSRFVGMLTDSRSFLSFPRHEYFRRILCNIIGQDVEDGLLPVQDLATVQQMVQNICYYNAKNYFNF